jgi:ribonucleoside-diphosphate reductase alpha chain
LSEHEKDVYKSAFEIDQRWLIDLAAQRTPYICQSQSLNVFIPADVHKKDLHQIHFQAWKKGIKSMYYLRSMSIQRSDVVSNMGQSTNNISDQENSNDYEECLSCQ